MAMRFPVAPIAAALLVLVCAAAATAQEAARTMLSPPAQAEWSAVGRLTITAQGFCTATAIAPDVVLTAAHCVIDPRKHTPVDPSRVHFLAGMRAGTFVAHATAARILITPGFDRRSGNVAADIALVVLETPLPDTVRPLLVDFGARPDLPLTLLSYGIDRSQFLSMERGCRLDRAAGGILYTTCEGVPGVSGAPILQNRDGVLAVTGVASAVLRKRNSATVKGPVLAAAATRPQLEALAAPVTGVSYLSGS